MAKDKGPASGPIGNPDPDKRGRGGGKGDGADKRQPPDKPSKNK